MGAKEATFQLLAFAPFDHRKRNFKIVFEETKIDLMGHRSFDGR